MVALSPNEACRRWLSATLATTPRRAFVPLPSHLTRSIKAELWGALRRYRPALAALLEAPDFKATQAQFGGVVEVPAADLQIVLDGMAQERP
jgi:hypothetical protein